MTSVISKSSHHIRPPLAAKRQSGRPKLPGGTEPNNESYRQKGDKYFSAFAKAQDLIIRNIVNQVKNAHGPVEYGIEHLKTPLLMIVGHTGCGAVKAALGDTRKLSAPIRDELKAALSTI